MEDETKTAEAPETPTEEQQTSVATEDETKDESAPSEGKAEPEEPSGEVDEEGKPKKKGGYQRRIEKLSAQLTHTEEEAAYWREKALAKDGQAPKAEPPAVKAKPTPEDFKLGDGETYDHAAFTEAMVEWKADQIVQQRFADEAKAKETETRTEQQQREAKEYYERELTFADSVDDYEEVAGVAMGALQQTNTPALASIGPALIASERGPELLYYLGQHPDEAQRIANLSPTRAVMALGQLEARLAEQEPENPDEKTATTPPPVSRAPKPVSPVKKPSAGIKLRPDDPTTADKMTTEEWLKARNEQEHQRIRAQRGR